MDLIIVKGLKVFAYHGVNTEEKDEGQVFILDIEAQADLSAACKTDKLTDTISYAQIIKSAKSFMVSEKNDLIERAAERVADGLLGEFPAITAVKIKLMKPDAPIKADFDYVAIEIERKRSDGKL